MEFRKIEDCDITVTEDGKEKIFKSIIVTAACLLKQKM